MHQQTHCHTLPKPFSKIFFFRIYVPTTHSTDIDSDETSVRLPQIPRQSSPHKPIHQRHCPHPQTQIPHSTNTTPIQLPQTHTAPQTPTTIRRHPRDARPPRRCRRTAKRCHTPTLTQHQCTRNWTGRTDRISPYKTRQDQATAAIEPARYQTGQVQDQIRQDQTH